MAREPREREDLEREIITAHAMGDTHLLAELYRRGADLMRAQADVDAEAFLLTQAYVYALEAGHCGAAAMHRRLKTLGREA